MTATGSRNAAEAIGCQIQTTVPRADPSAANAADRVAAKAIKYRPRKPGTPIPKAPSPLVNVRRREVVSLGRRLTCDLLSLFHRVQISTRSGDLITNADASLSCHQPLRATLPRRPTFVSLSVSVNRRLGRYLETGDSAIASDAPRDQWVSSPKLSPRRPLRAFGT